MVIETAEVGTAQTFYGAMLGLRSENPQSPRFKIGPTVLELRAESSTDLPAQPSIDHFALNVESIYAAYDTLKNTEVGIKAPPHTTEIGHRNMQRALLAFSAPDDFTIQISETVDPRPHLKSRRAAKSRMSSHREDADLFGGVDHISMYCNDFSATRSFYRDLLSLEEFFYSDSREEGEEVAPGFEQAAFAIGGTDIELASDDNWNDVRPGRFSELSFSTENIDKTRDAIAAGSVRIEEESPVGSLSLRDPDGLLIRIVGVD